MNKIKNSLMLQTSFLFFISTLIIIGLWTVFYLQELKQEKAQKITRYMRAAEFFQPMLFRFEPIAKEHLDAFAMQYYTKEISQEPFFQRGNKNVGLKLYKIDGENILKIYNPIHQITLQDIAQQEGFSSIHTVFSLLLILQLLLYLRLKSSFAPLSKLHTKFQSLQKGDLSPLNITSKYEEIQQITVAYNKAIQKLDYLLNMREMFNKIFMHELKTPIAKGMFYLKMPQTPQRDQKLYQLFTKLNEEIDDFARIESLILHNSDQNRENTPVKTLLLQSMQKLDLTDSKDITIIEDAPLQFIGDKDLWILCFKNIIDNALKYAEDKKLYIDISADELSFKNKAAPLPVDITKPIQNWKIEKDKRHNSSTGYGFGLFIITTIIKAQGYMLEYNYNQKDRSLQIKIHTP